jgi:BirA family biotin operon repressor/biotin-[acetyl-CoA-carboxylase] ligase
MNNEIGKLDYPATIRAARTTRWLGRPLYFYLNVTSSNDIMANMARNGADAGTIVVADYQSQGKGRLGRRWQAPAGTSLLFSLLFRPSWPPERASWLTMIAGLATVRAVESICGLNPTLKWPNDLMLPVSGHWHKFGGILSESLTADGQWQATIIGIGINVNIDPLQIGATRVPATSLMLASGQRVERAVLLNELLTTLEQIYAEAERGVSPRASWESCLVTLGRRVVVSHTNDNKTIAGTAIRTDEWGRLFVRDDNGLEHVVSAGDVTLQVDNSPD